MSTLPHLLINSDLGEGWPEVDRRLMPFIDQANIACGGHAGDERSMIDTIILARQHNVAIGAHPSYPDKENFGRQSLNISLSELELSLFEQVENLYGLCQNQGTRLRHIKAHGALYNDAMQREELLRLLIKLAHSFRCSLMLQSIPVNERAERAAEELGVQLIFEGFADRAYDKSGALVARTQPHAVHNNIDTIVAQSLCFARKQPVPTSNGQSLMLKADSLCVHGDSPIALESVRAIYDALR